MSSARTPDRQSDEAVDDFEEKLRAQASRRFDKSFKLRGDFSWIPRDVQWAVACVARLMEVSAEKILTEHNLTHEERNARMIAVYIINTEGSVSMSDIARELDLDLGGISKICQRVEDLRSDARWDELLNGISNALNAHTRIRAASPPLGG